MIRLLEHEAKRLLAQRGFAIPRGALHPALPEGAPGPWVVKAQVLSGGRGKAGGIRIAQSRGDIPALADAIGRMTINAQPVQAVYVEEKLDAVRELYLAAHVDRDRGRPVILASARGGVDIESLPREQILEWPIDPLIGLRDYAVGAIVRGLGADAALEPALRETVVRLYDTLVAEDAELVEINPLIVDTAGRIVAADAKIILDEDAAFRHPGRKSIPDGTEFERKARALEVIGVELAGDSGGDIAAMMNGAGMTMATLDQVVAMGGSIRALVELHGAMWRGPAHIAEVIDLMLGLKPKVLLVNVYFQFRSLDTIAEGIAQAIARHGPGLPPVVVRMRGVKEAEARRILDRVDCFVTDDFATACREAISRCPS